VIEMDIYSENSPVYKVKSILVVKYLGYWKELYS
jgi:hypothetical protein